MPPRGGDKIRKVSSKRQDAMLAQMQKESEEVRVIEQMTFVMEEMKLDATVADSCHSIAVKAKKRRESDQMFHRNHDTVLCVAVKVKADSLKQIQVFKPSALKAIIADKKATEQWFLFFTGYAGGTKLEVVEMPIDNFTNVSAMAVEKTGTLQLHREVLFTCTGMPDTNFDFGPFRFAKPVLPATVVCMIVHAESGHLARLPNQMQIPLCQIGFGKEHYQLTRWAHIDTCTFKGPGGFSMNVRKMFAEDQQNLFNIALCQSSRACRTRRLR